MAQNSKIEWTTHTANLWHGCTKVHEGCDNCYAETLSKRWGNDVWGNNKPRKEIKSVWNDLAKYQKLAKEAGEIHSVFVGSMMEAGMKVLDTHLGSQSSRISANKYQLNFVGFETDEEYFNKGNKRYDDFVSQTRLF